MRVESLQCPSCAASVSPDKKKCESCGSYYAVVESGTSLLTPAVRLFKSGGQFTFIYGPRKFFLMGRHSVQTHVSIRDREHVTRAGISRVATRIILSEVGPNLQRVGRSPVHVTKPYGEPRELSDSELVPLISGMTIGFGLSGHVWKVQIRETSFGDVGVLFCEPGDMVHHLLVANNVPPSHFYGSGAQLADLGVVRRTFDEGWVPALLEEAGESHDFPSECDHVWAE